MNSQGQLSSIAGLAETGCIPYLDTLDRSLIKSGTLRRLIETDRISGVTTNPVIFGKAIAEGSEYDKDLISSASEGSRGDELFLRLMIDDVRAAADVLHEVYESSGHAYGYVSLEVLPELAHDTNGTMAMAHALWERVDRPNLLVKVPATREGIVAIEELVAGGVNVNVTTIFSARTYEEVFWAYLRGQQRRRVPDVVSVASFFVSRIDNAVDAEIENRVDRGALDVSHLGLRGQAALASARVVYESYKDLHQRPACKSVLSHGGLPQRLVWASMLPRNPAYLDVKYVEGVAFPDTIATIPMATLDAFRDHGVIEPSRVTDREAADRTLRILADAGISMDAVAEELLGTVLGVFGQAIVDLRRVVDQRLQGTVAVH